MLGFSHINSLSHVFHIMHSMCINFVMKRFESDVIPFLEAFGVKENVEYGI